MTTGAIVARQTFFSAISFASNGLSFVLVIVAARILGPEDYGTFAVAMAFAVLLEPLTDLGMRRFLTREVARDRGRAGTLFETMAGVRIMLVFPAVLVLVSAAHLVGYNRETRLVVYALAVAMVLRSFKFGVRGFFQAFSKFGYEALLLVGERLAILGIGFFVLVSGYGLLPFVLVFPLVRILDLIVTMFVFRAQIARPRIAFDQEAGRKMLVASLPFALAHGMGVLYSRIDFVMLSVMRPVKEAGWYGAAYTFIDATDLIPALLATSVFPTLSLLAVSNRSRFKELASRTVKYLYLLIVPAACVGIGAAHPLIELVFGTDYREAAPALQILLAALVFSHVADLSTTLLHALDRPYAAMRSLIYSVALNVVLNLALIPSFGYIGAAISTALAQCAHCGFQLFQLSDMEWARAARRNLGRILAAGLASAALAHLLLPFSLPVAALGAASAYVSLIFAMRVVDGTDLAAAGGLIRSFGWSRGERTR